MDEIYRIVLERNKQRKVLTERDIRRICNIIIANSGFEDKIFVAFDEPEKDNDSVYAYTMDNCVIFYKNIMDKVQEDLYAKCDRKLDGCKTDFFNHFIVEAIFHEFRHIAQYDRIARRKKDIETRLMLLCSKLKSIKDFYVDYYGFFPEEKQAYSESGVDAYRIYNRMPKEIISDNDKKYYAELAMENLIKNYSVDSNAEVVASPSETLLYRADFYNLSKFGIDKLKFFDLIRKENRYSLYKRLSLGLPITYEEYAYANLLYDCIKEGQKVDFAKKLQLK